MNSQKLIEEINNIESDSSEFEKFFGYLPNNIKERKQFILKFNKTLKDEKRKLKELKCKKTFKGEKKNKKQTFLKHHHQFNDHLENKGLFNKAFKSSKNLEKKIQQLNKKKQFLSSKTQLIESKINFLKEIKESKNNI
ncbi:hypothetical protein ACTFIZ_010443 [Dictyostelium cf. discoideum]